MAILFLAAIPLALLAWFVWQPRWVERRRARVRGRPFPAAWREILRRRVPIFQRLPADLQLQLQAEIIVRH